MPRNDRGAVLLEVVAALALLGTAGLSMIAAQGAAVRAEREARVREHQMMNADRALTATALLARPDLDRRLGVRRVGKFLVEVQRPERELYRLSVRDATAPGIDLLVTVVYRKQGGAE